MKAIAQMENTNFYFFFQIPHQLAYMKNLSDPTNLSSVTAMDKLLKNPHMLINKAGKKIVDLVQYSTATQASKADR